MKFFMTMTKNSQVAEAWIRGESEKIKTKHLFFENRVIYSYGYHFPIAIKLNDCVIVHNNRYSNTTARHKSLVRRAIGNMETIELEFEELKRIAENITYFKINNKSELFAWKIQEANRNLK